VRRPGPGAACWIDGVAVAPERAALALDDPAALSGVGVFETLALRDGRPLEISEHLARLEQAARRLAIDPPALAPLAATVHAVAGLPGPARACGWLKVILTGGGRSIVLRDALDAAEQGQPATAILLPWRRDPRDPLVGVKSLSFAGHAVGLALARRSGADEGLWLNHRGHLAEGCTSNLFLVQGRRLHTAAPREGIRAGVMRELVLRAARHEGWIVHEGRVRYTRLQRASEAFLTSSLRGVRPLLAVDGRPVGSGAAGPATQSLAAAVARLRSVRLDTDPLLPDVSSGGEKEPREER
jgi:branched-chain amino acid aminotransferase